MQLACVHKLERVESLFHAYAFSASITKSLKLSFKDYDESIMVSIIEGLRGRDPGWWEVKGGPGSKEARAIYEEELKRAWDLYLDPKKNVQEKLSILLSAENAISEYAHGRRQIYAEAQRRNSKIIDGAEGTLKALTYIKAGSSIAVSILGVGAVGVAAGVAGKLGVVALETGYGLTTELAGGWDQANKANILITVGFGIVGAGSVGVGIKNAFRAKQAANAVARIEAESLRLANQIRQATGGRKVMASAQLISQVNKGVKARKAVSTVKKAQRNMDAVGAMVSGMSVGFATGGAIKDVANAM